MPTNAEFRAVLTGSEKLADHRRISAAILAVAARIDIDHGHVERPVFLTVMNGGLFFAGELALNLHTDFEFDYVHASRYHGTAGAALNWIKKPELDLSGRDVLLVDDILDEGPTLLAIRDYCHDQGAASVRIAVLADKQHDRRVPGIVADYACLTIPDRYVFGFGMDWNGHGRNLPAIHALADDGAGA